MPVTYTTDTRTIPKTSTDERADNLCVDSGPGQNA